MIKNYFASLRMNENENEMETSNLVKKVVFVDMKLVISVRSFKGTKLWPGGK